MTTNNTISRLSLSDTNVFKGVAILFMLCHHCLEGGQTYQDVIIHGRPLVQTFSSWCKICVVIFVFLSGYGLTISTNKNGGIGNVMQFYRKRYTKLMKGYWIIFAIFVPIGILLCDRTLTNVYGGGIENRL